MKINFVVYLYLFQSLRCCKGIRNNDTWHSINTSFAVKVHGDDDSNKNAVYPSDLVFLPPKHHPADNDVISAAADRYRGLLEVADARGNTLLHMAVDRGLG
jgi:hypothetical protein